MYYHTTFGGKYHIIGCVHLAGRTVVAGDGGLLPCEDCIGAAKKSSAGVSAAVRQTLGSMPLIGAVLSRFGRKSQPGKAMAQVPRELNLDLESLPEHHPPSKDASSQSIADSAESPETPTLSEKLSEVEGLSASGAKSMQELPHAPAQEANPKDIAERQHKMLVASWELSSPKDRPQKGHIPRGSSPQTLSEHVAYLGGGLSEEEVAQMCKVIKDFGLYGFGKIRRAQQTGYSDERVPLIEKYIEHAPKWDGGETYRGVDLGTDDVEKIFAALASPTREYDPNANAMASWTSSLAVAKNYASLRTVSSPWGGRTQVIFKCATQKKGTSIKHLTQTSVDEEVLVSQKARYRIEQAEYDEKGWLIVSLSEIDD